MATLINDSFKKVSLPISIGVSGSIGTAPNTVDKVSAFNLTATLGGLILTIPNPTDTLYSDIVEVSNVGTNSFIIYGVTLLQNQFVTLLWNGTVWQSEKSSGANIVTNWYETVTSVAPINSDSVKLSHNAPQNPDYGGMWLHNGVIYSYGTNVKGVNSDESSDSITTLNNPIPHGVDPYDRLGNLIAYKPIFSKFWLNRYVAFALDQNQKLWVKGWNNTGASGIPTLATSEILESFTLVTGVLNTLNIVDIVMGEGDYANTDYNCSVFAITSTGSVYSWGQNQWGQLGIGNTTTPQVTPTQVTLPVGTVVTKAFVSANAGGQGVHSAILDNTGKLYTCGYNANGQLGLGNTTQQTLFTLSITGVLDAYLVSQDSYIITTTGSVSATGNNGSGSHGRGVTTSTTSWLNCTSFTGVASKIVASKHGGAAGNTLYLIDTTKNLWVCGFNNYGQLGLGSSNVTQQNIYVLLTSTQLPIQGQVKEAWITGNAASTGMVLGENGDLFTAGYNVYGQRGTGQKTDSVLHRSTWSKTLIPTSIVTCRPAAEQTTGTFLALDVNSDLWTCGYRSQLPNTVVAAGNDISQPIKILWGRNAGSVVVTPTTGPVTAITNANGTTTVDAAIGGAAVSVLPTMSLADLVTYTDNGTDYVTIYDASTTSYKKVLLDNFLNGQIVKGAGPFTLTSSDRTVIVTNAAVATTVTLPDPATCRGRIYTIARGQTSTGAITITSTGAAVIQSSSTGALGATTTLGLIGTYTGRVTYQSDGTNWYFVG